MPVINFRQETIDALKKGVPPMMLLSIDLPAASGGPVYWTNYPWNVVYKGQTYNSINPFNRLDEPGGGQPVDGTFSIIVDDPERGWFKRFEKAGPRGRDVVLDWVVPYNEDDPTQIEQIGGFSGTTQSLRTATETQGGIQTTVLIVEDKAYYDYKGKGNPTAKGYQRSLGDKRDNSHDLAQSARRITWHHGG